LLLCVADAFMTVTLLAGGAVEMNPVMALAVDSGATWFATLKMALTGISVTLMVFFARYRFMRVVRVEWVVYAIFFGYAGLLCYEFGMLQGLIEMPRM